MEFRKHTLSNGLQIVAECNPRAFSTSLGFFVNTGSRDEVDANWGVSHFLEHMTFKGTPRRSGEDVNRELDEIGSSSNAYTSEEQTVYYASVLEEYQDRAVDLLCDMMRPALRSDDFETEKQVILEEIAKYDDQPPFNANEKAMAAHFAHHPLGRNVLGTVASVSGLTPEAMRDYFNQRYSPGNMTLVGSGNVDFDRLVRLADDYCGGWQAFATQRDIRPAPPNRGFDSMAHELATQQYAVQVCSAPSGESEQRYAARLLSIILGDDSGSRLYWDLVETGRADCAVLEYYSFQGSGIFMTFLSCEPEDAADNLRHIDAAWRTAIRDGVTEGELRQAQNKLCAHIILSSERASSRLFSVGSNWIKRQQYLTVRETVEAYRAVTLEDLRKILDAHPLTEHTTFAVGPEKLAFPFEPQ